MFVTNKRLYKELYKVADILEGLADAGIIQARSIDDVKERINYTLNKVLTLTERVDALEAKKQRKVKTKTTKKKGK